MTVGNLGVPPPLPERRAMTAATYAVAGWTTGVVLGSIPFVRAYRGLTPFERSWLGQRLPGATTR